MDDLVSLMTMMVGVVVALTVLVTPVLIYTRVTRKHADTWAHTAREYVPRNERSFTGA